MSSPLSVFYFLADTPRRRDALRAEPGSAERYVLYGLDQLVARGDVVTHNLESLTPPPAWARLTDRLVAAALRSAHGTGGDLAPALEHLHAANRSDVVVATIDRMGIPLTLLARARLLRAPLVYVSIGLPERLDRLGGRMRELHLSALARADVFVAYSEHEANVIREALQGRTTAPVVFIPFGVDTEFFRPLAGAEPDLDVVSIGADPHRDYTLLLRVAVRHPEWRFHLVVSPAAARVLGAVPENVAVEADVPFAAVRDLLRRARVVALPVVDNSYSGATTVLLQALATGRPVVVSRTAAIESGYGLADRETCKLVAPGDDAAFDGALTELVSDPELASTMGGRGRELAETRLTWSRYVDALRAVLAAAVARHSPP